MRKGYTIPDVIQASRVKLVFLNETFSQAKPDEHFILSPEAMSGFYYIVEDIESDLEEAYNELVDRPQACKQEI